MEPFVQTPLFWSETLRGWIRGAEYETLYPAINQPNVFSISTLAWAVEKQVKWKLEGKRKAVGEKISIMMFNGKAKHEFVQSRLRAMGEGWQTEKEVATSIPFEWQNYPFHTIILLGHLDAIRYEPFEIFELKTTDWGPSKISDYQRIQAGTYAHILSLSMGFYPRVIMAKTNHDVTVEDLAPAEISKWWREMTFRALEAARQVDNGVIVK